MSLPIIIQGGMGVGVSNWKLARSVSQLGQLGVVSGAILAVVFARRLQQGDSDGRMRHALAHFPFADVAERVLDMYYVPGGKAPGVSFASCAMPNMKPGQAFNELTVTANFAEVFLAKEGHQGPVGINLLEKIQMTTLPSLYGAMLAKVDAVLMGAGIPRSIPGILDLFSKGQKASIKVDVANAAQGDEFHTEFDPQAMSAQAPESLNRPDFLAIVSSSTLATSLARKSNGKVNGFIIEADCAGGHNAPPRGAMQLNSAGEPIYGPRDIPDLAAFRALGFPFWLAGARATPEGLADARAAGAEGIQVGTAFAFCSDSGIKSELRQKAIAQSCAGTASVFTDPLASPTGFPFKVLQMENTLSGSGEYARRERICDLGYLREAYKREDGTLGYRCAAEPEADFIRKGGTAQATVGRKCLCNGLASTVGLAQTRKGVDESDLITAGNDVTNLKRYLAPGATDYSAADVIRYLQSKPNPA